MNRPVRGWGGGDVDERGREVGMGAGWRMVAGVVRGWRRGRLLEGQWLLRQGDDLVGRGQRRQRPGQLEEVVRGVGLFLGAHTNGLI